MCNFTKAICALKQYNRFAVTVVQPKIKPFDLYSG